MTEAEMLVAQLLLGVYPGAGWDNDEMNWRIYSFLVALVQLAGIAGGAPALPAWAAGHAAVPAIGAGVGAPNLAPSPVAAGVDATEKGQLGYHIGTAIGGHLAACMATGHANSVWFPFHLSRAQHQGGAFVFNAPDRPDIVTFAIDPATGTWYHFVVWENKGHCGNWGGAAAMAPALAQARALQTITALPGVAPIAGIGAVHGLAGAVPALLAGGLLPECHVASMVDVFHGNFRVQVIDPPAGPRKPVSLSPAQMDSFLRAFYAPFERAVRSSSLRRSYDGVRFRTVALAKNVQLGLDDEICRALRTRGSVGALAAAVGRVTARGYANKQKDKVFVDRTGVSVELPKDWRQQGSTSAG
jgi:hypothetical protein